MSSSSITIELRRWFSLPSGWVTAPLAASLLGYCWRLWPEWSRNPDLSHGIFTPLIFALLLAESRTVGDAGWFHSGRGTRMAAQLAGWFALMLFAIAGLLAASLGWSHALVDFVLAVSLSGALLSGLLSLVADRRNLVPLNWISLTAIGLWVLSAPLPSGTYSRLTLGLQGFVASNVLHSLHFLGIPARQSGNLIQLVGTTVGIEEACSGIRSLLSCLYAGFFFAAWQVRSVAGRALLIVLAPLLAIVMNFLRSLSLTLMANAGVKIEGFWHDATGFAILGLTALLLGLLALALSPRLLPSPSAGDENEPRDNRACRRFALVGLGAGVLALVFAFYGRPASVTATDNRDVTALLPDAAEGWQVRTTPDLYQFADILRTKQLAERTYFKEIDGQPVLLTAYVAHWEPGQAPVSLVASHTPDACWPGSGWNAQPDPNLHTVLQVGALSLPIAEHRVFQNGQNPPLHVWFWHVYDGRVINFRDPYSVPALLQLALQYGFRREGGQYFIRLSSNADWTVIAHDPLIKKLLGNMAQIGLKP